MSPELAEMLSQKIREMEQSCAAESDKTQKAHKTKARTTAKSKVKEAKKLMADAEMDAVQKAELLWEMLSGEHSQACALWDHASRNMRELGDVERGRASCSSELSKALAVKSKLESLCRQLQQQSDALVEERRRLTDTERRRRHDLADEYQRTIEDVKKKMDSQANERARLAKENEDLRTNFKGFFERYDGREKELQEQQRGREDEVVVLNQKLEAQAAVYKREATREARADHEHQELEQAETVLREQLQTYSSKFNNFQDSLSKSDKVLSQYKRQKNKMQRRVETLERENQELDVRNERRAVSLAKDTGKMAAELSTLQDRCRELQAERLGLRERCASSGTSC